MDVQVTTAAHDGYRAKHVVILVAVLLFVVGGVWAESIEGFMAYVLVALPAILPSIVWVHSGAPGIPVLPVTAAFHYLYFAVPLLRESPQRSVYDSSEVLFASVTVALFLAAATVVWWLLLRRTVNAAAHSQVAVQPGGAIVRIVIGGIIFGNVFYLLTLLGALAFSGSFFGTVRSIAVTGAAIACYLAGYCRARGILAGGRWWIVLLGIGLLVAMAWSTLFLVSGLWFVIAVIFGYTITAKRVPWKLLVPFSILVFILHAGKGEMREKYWNTSNFSTVAIVDIPSLMTEWFEAGIGAIADGTVQENFVDRASLLYMLLYVERLTPAEIPYFEGETYWNLPRYLVPRFIDPDKPESQGNLALLNVRYGLQTVDETRSTTIGWGIISEAFANFGLVGVLFIGLLYGALTALFTRGSANVSAVDLRTLVAVAALVSMCNLEADFAYLMTNLWQAVASALIFFVILKQFLGREQQGARTAGPVRLRDLQ